MCLERKGCVLMKRNFCLPSTWVIICLRSLRRHGILRFFFDLGPFTRYGRPMILVPIVGFDSSFSPRTGQYTR